MIPWINSFKQAATNNMADRAKAQQSLQVVVERILAARRERVFRAWTDPVLMGKWFAPLDKEAVGVEAKAVVGGSYRIGMRGQDGSIEYVGGKYIEIKPPERLVFTWAWESEPPELESQVTLEFYEQGDSTRLVLTHQRLATPERQESHRRGWVSCIQHLEMKISDGSV